MDTTSDVEDEWKRNASELFSDCESDDQSQNSKKQCVESCEDEMYEEALVANKIFFSSQTATSADTRLLPINGSKFGERASADVLHRVPDPKLRPSAKNTYVDAFSINDSEDKARYCQIITDDEYDSDTDSDGEDVEYSFSDFVNGERARGKGNFFENVRKQGNTCSYCDSYRENVSNKLKSSDAELADKAMKMNMEDFFVSMSLLYNHLFKLYIFLLIRYIMSLNIVENSALSKRLPK